MSFFEPLAPAPDPDELQPTGWGPPVWDRPSEAMLGAAVAATKLVARNDRVALALRGVAAYPNGFTFSLVYVGNPLAPRPRGGHGVFHPGIAGPGSGPRIGIAFADGTRAVDSSLRVVGGRVQRPEIPKDDDGIPTVPLLRMVAGGGGRQFAMRYWCWPLPPPGPMDVYLEWSAFDIPETKVTLDADAVRAAAPRAIAIWDHEPGET